MELIIDEDSIEQIHGPGIVDDGTSIDDPLLQVAVKFGKVTIEVLSGGKVPGIDPHLWKLALEVGHCGRGNLRHARLFEQCQTLSEPLDLLSLGLDVDVRERDGGVGDQNVLQDFHQETAVVAAQGDAAEDDPVENWIAMRSEPLVAKAVPIFHQFVAVCRERDERRSVEPSKNAL